MNETILTSVVSIVSAIAGGLLTLVATLLSNYSANKRHNEELWERKNEFKSNILRDIYTNIIGIVNIYPNESPNDVLKNIEFAPGYLLEEFDSVIKNLDYQVEDYERTLDTKKSLTREEKNKIEVAVNNIKYAKKEILRIEIEYMDARERYDEFKKNGKSVFDLYAGIEVRNSLVEFETVVHNVFVSGMRAGDRYEPLSNIINVSRNNLIQKMREDIGN